MTKNSLLLLLGLLLFVACNDEKIDIPDTGRKLVINGLISTDDMVNVSISKSVSLKTFGTGEYVNNDSASVYIFQNDSYIDSLKYSNSSKIHSNNNIIYHENLFSQSNYWSKNIYPIPGNKYKIVVKRKGLPDAIAKTIIPNLVKINLTDALRIKMAPDSSYDPFANNYTLICKDQLKCSVEFTDPSNETNYYYLDIINSIPSIFDPQSGDDPRIFITQKKVDFECFDPIIEEKLENEKIFFSDKLINGKKCKLTFLLSMLGFIDPRTGIVGGYSPNMLNIKSVYYFRLHSISKEFYDYLKNLKLYRNNYNNPLAEPVIVNSNIIGGYGIFAGDAVSRDSIVFQWPF